MTTPASEIVQRCGGNLAVATWLGLERTAVQRWSYPPPRGLGGRIPIKHWAALIQKAAENGVTISLEELMPQAVTKAVQAAKPKRRPRKTGAAA